MFLYLSALNNALRMLKISLNYRNLDYENYLTVLLLPKSSRAAAFAVRAFNVELARVSNKITLHACSVVFIPEDRYRLLR